MPGPGERDGGSLSRGFQEFWRPDLVESCEKSSVVRRLIQDPILTWPNVGKMPVILPAYRPTLLRGMRSSAIAA